MKKNKQTVEELVRVDLREQYGARLFSSWQGKDMPAQHWFCDSDDGSVILSFKGDPTIQSYDGGETWDLYAGRRAWPPSDRGIFQIGNNLLAMGSGRRFWRSGDGGLTWGGEHAIPGGDEFHFDGLGPPNCFSTIMTTAGRIVIVADYFVGQHGPDTQLLCSVYSDDWGDTWQASRLFGPAEPLPKALEGFGEPAVVELPNRRLWMVFRTLYGELWQSISRDGGASWHPPTPTGFASPIANCYAARDPYSRATVLCWNLTRPGIAQDFGSLHSLYRPRTNLVFSVSRDDTQTWSCPVVVEAQGGFYPTIHFTEDRMFIMYQSAPDEKGRPWEDYGLTLVVYDRHESITLPAWTPETIRPYVDKGLVAGWRAIACQPPSQEIIT